MHKNLCCETAMFYVCVYIATLMALSHKSIKIKSWCTYSIADTKPKKRKNLENEGSAYLPPTCPSLTVTANSAHLISGEKACPSALSSLAPSPSPQKHRQWRLFATALSRSRKEWCAGAIGNWSEGRLMLLWSRTEARIHGLWFMKLVFIVKYSLVGGGLVSVYCLGGGVSNAEGTVIAVSEVYGKADQRGGFHWAKVFH